MSPLFSYSAFKSVLDRFFALSLLLIFLPLLIFVYLFVRLRLGSPVFFLQQRPGYRGRPFWLVKFRTMTNKCDHKGNLLPDSERLTSFGRFLRSTSIDELPGLVNILRGEMSFIGPRPLLMQYLPLYSPSQARRHDVMPGFSGWAQINGRNSLSWDDKFLLDVWYVDHQNFRLDFFIFLTTLWKVVKRDGIDHSPGVPMPKFKGSSND